MKYLQAGLAFLLVLIMAADAAVAANGSEQASQQEVLKAKASKWREAGVTEDNPTSLGELEVSEAFPDREWWTQFQDPHLTAYIQQAVNANLSLALAQERIEEARAIARASLGRELPQLSMGPVFNRQRNSATIIRSARPGQNGGQGNATGSGNTGGGGFALGQTINFFSLPLNTSYEVDLWQKNRDRTRAADKQVEASQRDFQAVHVILATEVANAYFNLLTADRLIELQKEVIDTAESDLGHARRRFEAGLTDEEDVVLRQGRLTDFKAQLQDYYQLQALALNQLAYLMGQTPLQVSGLARASWAEYAVPTEVTAGIPSEMLVRRPDVLAAEDRLQASGLLVRVARKEMLPSFTINGQFGFSTASLKDLFDWESRVASIGASMLQGLFTGGQARANLRIFKSQYEQQLLSYRDTILQAFREVDDSLASLKAHRNAYEEYASSLTTLEQRQRIQQNRLEAGVISEADISPVTLEVLLAQQGLARSKLAALTDTLSLYKALGGGY